MNKRLVLVPFMLLTLAALACGSGSSGGTPEPAALYRENFSSDTSGWCVDSDSTSALDYSGGKYVFEVNDPEWFVWCNPDEDFDNIHLEVTAENTGGTEDTVFGLMCHYQTSNSDFYYVGITTAGDYTIRLYTEGEDEILDEGTTDAVDPDAASYRIGMDCVDGAITLYVDGDEIASANDDTYASGDIGLYAWTGDETPAEVRYDDLVVTAP